MHSDPVCFASGSVVLVGLSDHLLVQRIAQELVSLLKQDRHIRQLSYFPAGRFPDPGGRAPDLFMTLDLDSARHSGVLGKTLDAEVRATIGTSLVSASHSYSDHLTPPMIGFRETIRV